tara:strand:- start:725 stop:1567 length:843 start_codon:yes stop_codon:yes gene_type:complete
MGIINKILPISLKPLSRDIGFSFRTLIYKFKCINRKINPYPIFILGNQKSGTSAIASLLGSFSGKITAIDLFLSGFRSSHFTNWKFKKISTKDFINKNKVEFSAEIIKEPHLSIFFDELKTEYPESKFVMIIRNPFDNIRSILDRLDVKGKKNLLNEKDRKKFFHSWKLLLNNKWIGGSKNHYIEVLAERWNTISNVYLDNKENIILVKYEDFISDKSNTIQLLAKKLELTQNGEISHLLDKQFQPKGRRKNQDVKVFFGDENYSKIYEICEENMNKIGY